jgi:hypothetical protein
MKTSKARGPARLCFAVPAFIFLFFTALETVDNIGFEVAPATTPASWAQAAACAESPPSLRVLEAPVGRRSAETKV